MSENESSMQKYYNDINNNNSCNSNSNSNSFTSERPVFSCNKFKHHHPNGMVHGVNGPIGFGWFYVYFESKFLITW